MIMDNIVFTENELFIHHVLYIFGKQSTCILLPLYKCEKNYDAFLFFILASCYSLSSLGYMIGNYIVIQIIRL